MDSKLKPCPFCGKQPKTVHEGMGEAWIHCKCQDMRQTKEQAIKAWNTRQADWVPEDICQLINTTINALDWGHGPHIRDFIADLKKLLPKAPTTNKENT